MSIPLVLSVAVLVLTLNGRAACADAVAAANTFDYFYFVRQWPASFCNDHECKHTPPPQFKFTIHGLWPQRRDGTWPQYCDEGSHVTWRDLRGLLHRLFKSWPSWTSDNIAFWDHEWTRHGTCAEGTIGSPHAFFKAVLRLHRDLRIERALRHADIHPSRKSRYSATDISDAIADEYGSPPTLVCDDDGQLMEVWMCIDKHLQPINCADARGRGAGVGAADALPRGLLADGAAEAHAPRPFAADAHIGATPHTLRYGLCKEVLIPPPSTGRHAVWEGAEEEEEEDEWDAARWADDSAEDEDDYGFGDEEGGSGGDAALTATLWHAAAAAAVQGDKELTTALWHAAKAAATEDEDVAAGQATRVHGSLDSNPWLPGHQARHTSSQSRPRGHGTEAASLLDAVSRAVGAAGAPAAPRDAALLPLTALLLGVVGVAMSVALVARAARARSGVAAAAARDGPLAPLLGH